MVKLTDEQQLFAVKKAKVHTCQLCGGQDWQVLEHMMELRLHDSGAISLDGQMPLVAIVCKNCQQVALLNAVALGLAPRMTGG